MMKEELIRKMYDAAVVTIERRKDEVTTDLIDVEAEYTIKILEKVLGI